MIQIQLLTCWLPLYLGASAPTAQLAGHLKSETVVFGWIGRARRCVLRDRKTRRCERSRCLPATTFQAFKRDNEPPSPKRVRGFSDTLQIEDPISSSTRVSDQESVVFDLTCSLRTTRYLSKSGAASTESPPFEDPEPDGGRVSVPALLSDVPR